MSRRSSISSLTAALGSLAALACAARAAPPASTPEPVSASASAAPPSADPPSADPPATTENAEPRASHASHASHPEATEEKVDPELAVRDITYVVTPTGLKVTVAGTRFVVGAVATTLAGGFGVAVNVEATANDGLPHSLSKPETGPLAFAGSVMRKGQTEAEHFGDRRAGEGELAVSDAALKIRRIWPMKGVRPLALGDALDLQVALWGLGNDANSRRPVKQFVHVRMRVDKGKPKAFVEPPPSVAGR